MNLQDILTPYESVRQNLRSSSDQLRLAVPRTKLSTYGDRAFYAAGPVLWNALPHHVKDSTLVATFKTALKT